MKSSILPTRGKLDGVQFGRAIAACMVVFYHTGRMLMLPQYTGHGTAGKDIFTFGNAGVDFFFTLSGFIIFYVHHLDINNPGRLRHYIWRRVTRIYPMYWAVTAVVIALAILKRDWATLNLADLTNSIFLVPATGYPLLGVGWTLQHEMLFYAAFAIAIFSRTGGIVVGFGWLGLIAAGFFDQAGGPFLEFVKSPYHLEFAFGIFAAVAAGRWQTPDAWLVAILGIVIFVGTAFFVDRQVLIDAQPVCRLLFGIASMLVLYGVSVAELRGQVCFPPWAAYLGAASYSIYLVHTIAIGLVARAVFHFPMAHGMPNLVFLGIGLLAIAAGCAAYQFVEIPLQAVIRRSRGSRHLPSRAAF